MSQSFEQHVAFDNKLLIIGFGSIGKAVLPLILRHIAIKPSQVTVITKATDGAAITEEYGVKLIMEAVTRENFHAILDANLSSGDFLLNLSVDVSSVALIEACQAKDVLYLDTCIEPWPGGYTDANMPSSARTNYALRESALALRKNEKKATAVITHGANPGLVSHFVKEAMINIAKDTGLNVSTEPASRDEWAALAKTLNIKAIHIAERDTQVASFAKRPGEFVNTWSIDGFISEGSQPAELGWGSHEKHLPHDAGHHEVGCKSAIYLHRPGASTRVRTWTPMAGPIHGFLITHGESISISDYFTCHDAGKHYRPTVHYAYHPCDDAVLSLHEFAGREWGQQETQRLLMDEVVDGVDELGVLLMGHAKNAYWFGSQLTIHEARELVPYNNATSLQVAVAVLAGMCWAIEHPEKGVTEPDEIDYRYIMRICRPYLGTVKGFYTDWTPLQEREKLFPEAVDSSDPWQFINIRVN